jgi:hypothetical protein
MSRLLVEWMRNPTFVGPKVCPAYGGSLSGIVGKLLTTSMAISNYITWKKIQIHV